MAEYIEREAALARVRPDDPIDERWAVTVATAKRLIRHDLTAAPAADVAPVVRCKDCERAERYERIDGTAGYYCGHPQNIFTYGERWDRVFTPVKEADDFCSYGARKDEENG